MDISIIYKIAAIGLLTAVISMLLKKVGKEEIATLVTIAGLILSLIIVLDMVFHLFSSIQSLFDF
ncbi:MAG: stage III sporulation protein AC [Clostridia bacterium]|nr:stage III sporulation protein AC [Clostridia bacterium]